MTYKHSPTTIGDVDPSPTFCFHADAEDRHPSAIPPPSSPTIRQRCRCDSVPANEASLQRSAEHQKGSNNTLPPQVVARNFALLFLNRIDSHLVCSAVHASSIFRCNNVNQQASPHSAPRPQRKSFRVRISGGRKSMGVFYGGWRLCLLGGWNLCLLEPLFARRRSLDGRCQRRSH